MVNFWPLQVWGTKILWGLGGPDNSINSVRQSFGFPPLFLISELDLFPFLEDFTFDTLSHFWHQCSAQLKVLILRLPPPQTFPLIWNQQKPAKLFQTTQNFGEQESELKTSRTDQYYISRFTAGVFFLRSWQGIILDEVKKLSMTWAIWRW